MSTNNSLNVNANTPLRPSYGGTGLATAGAPSRYVVSTVSGQAGFTTIQSAIDQAVTDGANIGAPATVWIFPGIYNEDLTLAPYVNLSAASGTSFTSVNITGNSVYSGTGNVVLTGIGFTAAGVTAALSFQSTGAAVCVLQSVALNASSGIGIECTSATTTLTSYNGALSSGEGGRCFNITNGFVEVIGNITAFTDTASTISGGTVRCISCDFQDSFNITGGAIQILNGIILSGTFECLTIGSSGQAIVVDTTMGSSATSTYIVTGTGILVYSGIVCIQANNTINPTVNISPLPALGSSLSLYVPLAGKSGGTGVANTGLTIDITNGAATGKLLTSDSSGNAAWAAPGYLTGAVLLSPAGDQIITAHGLTLAAGAVQSGLTTGGFAGQFLAYAPTSGLGSIALAATDNSGGFAGTITNISTTGNRIWSFPDATGTVALTSGIPSLGDFTFSGDTISNSTTNANITITPNGSGYMIFGNAATNPLVASTPDNSLINYGNPGTRPGYIISASYNASTNFAAAFTSARSRSASLSSNAALQAGDSIGLWDFKADTGATFDSRAQILGSVTTVGAKIGTQLQFYTASNAGVAVALAMTLTDAQAATFAASVTAATEITATAGAVTSGAATGGFAGQFQAFSTTSSLGSLSFTAANSGGNYANILTNASTTAAQTWTLPDASGTIALVSTSGGFVYTSVSGTTQAAAGGNAYILNNAAATTVTLPASGSSTIGDTIKIKGRSAAPWIIQANTSQIITDGSVQSSTAGTATSAAGTDSLQLVYVASNEWSIDWQLSSGIVLA